MLLVEQKPMLCRLPLGGCVVHFRSGIKNALLEGDKRFFLLRFRYFQVGNILSAVENGLQQRAYGIEQPSARLDESRSAAVGPACRCAERDVGRERCACNIGGVVGLCERGFRLSDVRTVAEQL